MSAAPPAVVDAIDALLPPLLGAFERVEWVQRHLYPPLAERLAEQLAPGVDALGGPLRDVEALAWPDDLHVLRDRLVDVARQTLELVGAFVEAARPPAEPIGLYRALRRFARAQEALYPLAPVLAGATYALLCGLRDGMPFTHLAPACGVLHPSLVANGDLARASGRPIYLVHGALDWMFPVYTAQMARDALQAAGARLVYREIADLSHTYPRDENAKILDWLTT